MHYDKDFALECRIARFHNIYGPYGTWKGGREKAPAAFCRKVSLVTWVFSVLCCSCAAAVCAGVYLNLPPGVVREHFCLQQ